MAEAVGKTRAFVGDVQEEMQKVTWPDWPQLKSSTNVILVFVVIIAMVIFGIDMVLTWALNVIRSLFGG